MKRMLYIIAICVAAWSSLAQADDGVAKLIEVHGKIERVDMAGNRIRINGTMYNLPPDVGLWDSQEGGMISQNHFVIGTVVRAEVRPGEGGKRGTLVKMEITGYSNQK